LRVLYDADGRVVDVSPGPDVDTNVVTLSDVAHCVQDELAVIPPSPKMANQVLVYQDPPTGYGAGVPDLLPPEIIQGIIRGHYDQIYECYNNGLARDPTLKGRVAAQFHILGDGTTQMGVHESTLPTDVTDCVLSVFAGMYFPHHGGDVGVTYPLSFSPQKPVTASDSQPYSIK
jgi:hypothetical protein